MGHSSFRDRPEATRIDPRWNIRTDRLGNSVCSLHIPIVNIAATPTLQLLLMIDPAAAIGPKSATHNSDITVSSGREYHRTTACRTTRRKRRATEAGRSALSGATPLSLLDTDIGAENVLDTLGRIEHGVFA
jgi:hypothetical protein